MPRRSDADEKIRRYLARQHLSDQQRLPPERELAVQLDLSRGQLRTGLARLKSDGLVWGRVGKGTFVGKEPPLDPRSVLQLSLLTNPRDIMETRLAIEPMLASLAALRASPIECAHLEKCVARTKSASDRASFQRWDDEFHQTVARAARNPLLLALFDAVNESRQREAWGAKRNHPLAASRRQSYIAQHAACLAAIKNRDAALAAAAMRRHLEFVAAVCDVFGTSSAVRVLQLEARREPAMLRRMVSAPKALGSAI
jgi:DNA-binding FadR family transcriptional regulator